MLIQQEIELKRENLNIQMAYDLFYGSPASIIDSMIGIQPRLNTSTIPRWSWEQVARLLPQPTF